MEAYMATAMQQPQMGLTFADVWAALMEDREAYKRSQEKTDEIFRRMDEDHRKTEEAQRKTEAEFLVMKMPVKETTANVNRRSARVDRVTKNVGNVNLSMGELVETLIAAKLWEKFGAYPYKFQRAYQRVELFDDTSNRKRTDIDILLTNGEYVMAVEVKRNLHKKDDVDDHVKRMELIRKFPPNQCGGKIVLGAMAGGAVATDVLEYAHSVGFFVLELTGDSVRLAKPPEGCVPRQW
jgi:hypothetical protein